MCGVVTCHSVRGDTVMRYVVRQQERKERKKKKKYYHSPGDSEKHLVQHVRGLGVWCAICPGIVECKLIRPQVTVMIFAAYTHGGEVSIGSEMIVQVLHYVIGEGFREVTLENCVVHFQGERKSGSKEAALEWFGRG